MHRLRTRFAFASLLSFALFLRPALAANLGLVDGTVHDYEDKPVIGTKVQLLSKDGRRLLDEHVTDENGHFEFEQVSFGTYRVRAFAPDGRSEEETVRVSSGDVVVVQIFLPLQGQTVDIVADRPKAPAPTRTGGSESTLERENIEELPRGDTASVNEILATQPGFVLDALGNLFVRGNHANIQYQMDGVPLPDSVSGLFGGFLSPKMIDSMEVLTGGLGAEYGDRLAAVVNLNSRKPSPQGEGELELQGGSYSTLNPSGFYGRKLGAVSLFAGGSYRTTSRALDPAVFGDLSHSGGDEERGFVRVDYDAGDTSHVSALGAYAHNFYRLPIDVSVPPLDPGAPDGGRTPDRFGNPPAPFFPHDTNQTENERDVFALLSVRHDFDPRTSLRAAMSYRHSVGSLFGDSQHALGPAQDPCSTDDQGNTSCASTSDVGRTADHVLGFVEQLFRFGENHVFKAGAQVDQLFGSTRYTSYTRSDALRGPDPSLTVTGTDDSRATTAGAYVEDRATFGPVVVNAGVRFDLQHVAFPASGSSSNDVAIGPRVGVAWSLGQATVVHAFGGLLWQPPPVLDAPAAARILGVVQPGQVVPYDLVPEQDRYAEIGIESRVVPELLLKLTGWGRLSKHQLDDIGVGNTNLVSPYNFREGRAGGIEAGAVAVLGDVRAFANVSLERALGRGIESAQYLFSPDDLANGSWQILDHVQTWTANAGTTYKRTFSQLSALLEYGSGLRTGPANDQHVPDHVRVDLSASHQFYGAPLRPMIAIDLVNAFDAHYAYRIANGFNGSHWAPGRSLFARLRTEF
jgi:outer membrane receptor for ferrienterochelin and colicins